MKHFYNILVFTFIFIISHQSTLPFRQKYAEPRETTSSHSGDYTAVDDMESSVAGCADCDCLTCNNTLPAPKKIINPYKQELSNIVPQKPFGSFCIKCTACLAVANEIEKVIKSSSQECETDPEKKKSLLQDIAKNIDDLCLTGFKKLNNFNLRSDGNHSIITNRFKCTKHVISNMDGHWTKKLRELCTLYISKINVEDISINVMDSIGNLTDTLCRGTGIFRDCSNIKSHENITMPLCEDCKC